jgi:hypothetical protein
VLLQLLCVTGSLRAPYRPGDLFPLIPLIPYEVYGDLARNSTRDLFASLEADLCASYICIGSTGPLLVSNRRQPVICSKSHLVSPAMDRVGEPRFKRRRRSRVTKTRRDSTKKKEWQEHAKRAADEKSGVLVIHRVAPTANAATWCACTIQHGEIAWERPCG